VAVWEKIYWAMESPNSRVNKSCWILGMFNKRLNIGKIERNILRKNRYVVDNMLQRKNNISRHLTRMNLREIIA
jgi:hypothetical protein